MLYFSALVLYAILTHHVLLTQATYGSGKISCKDERGRAVDWFYMYKLPKHYTHDATDDSDSTGLRYLYITSDDNDAWKLSPVRINDAESMPALTLQPLFDNATLLLLSYNDEYPNGTTIATGGHTKGVVASDGTTGLWLIHSVPKFPTIPRYEYPTSGEHYAQSFLCLTLSATELESVGVQLLYNEPNVYYARIPVMLGGRFPSLERVVRGDWLTEAPFHSLMQLTTLGGVEFKSFAKSGRFNGELYEEWLAPTLGVNLMVETWRNGAGKLTTNCSSNYKVYNINEVEERSLHVAFKSSNDHSKWAVSQATGLRVWHWRLGGADWICIGDINRQAHQAKRGGGTVCQKSVKLAKLYRDMIGVYEPCHRN